LIIHSYYLIYHYDYPNTGEHYRLFIKYGIEPDCRLNIYALNEIYLIWSTSKCSNAFCLHQVVSLCSAA